MVLVFVEAGGTRSGGWVLVGAALHGCSPRCGFLKSGCQEEPSKSLTVDHENTHLLGGNSPLEKARGSTAVAVCTAAVVVLVDSCLAPHPPMRPTIASIHSNDDYGRKCSTAVG